MTQPPLDRVDFVLGRGGGETSFGVKMLKERLQPLWWWERAKLRFGNGRVGQTCVEP